MSADKSGRPRTPFTMRRADHAIFQASAVSRGGRIADLAAQVGLPERLVRQRLSALRCAGVARWTGLHAPPKAGRPIETRTYVRLTSLRQPALAAFEARCGRDPDIEAAAMISGPFNYVLTTFHADHPAAREWAWSLAAEPCVDDVDQRLVTTKHGHSLPGVLWRD